MKLICKHTHNAFKKGEVYEGIELHNAIMIIREKDQKKFFYGLKRGPGVDFIETWFWTLSAVCKNSLHTERRMERRKTKRDTMIEKGYQNKSIHIR